MFVKGRVRRRVGVAPGRRLWGFLGLVLVSVSFATRGQTDIRGLVTA